MVGFMDFFNFNARDARFAGEKHDDADAFRDMKKRRLAAYAPENTVEHVLHALMFHVLNNCHRTARIKFSDLTQITRAECRAVTNALREYGFHAYVSPAWGIDGFVASVSWAKTDVDPYWDHTSTDQFDDYDQALTIIPSIVETAIDERVRRSHEFSLEKSQTIDDYMNDNADNVVEYADKHKTLKIVTELLDELSPTDRLDAIKYLVQTL